MSPFLMRAPARALVLAVALAAPSAALVAPSYAGSTAVVQGMPSEGSATPLNPKVEQYAANELYVEWERNEGEVNGWLVQAVSTTSEAVYSVEVGADETWAVLTDLPVSTYDVYIYPQTGERESPPAVVSDVDVVEAPGAVRSFKAKQVAPGKVTLTWAKPSSGPVTGYFAGFSRSESGDGKPVGQNATSTSFANLRPGKYTFELRAANGTVGGKASRMTLTVTNAVKRGAPTLSVADASLTRTQKVRASGTAPKGAQVELEFRPKGYSDFFVVGFDKADRKGRWSVSADVPQSGTLRAVAAATGRVSATKAITKR